MSLPMLTPVNAHSFDLGIDFLWGNLQSRVFGLVWFGLVWFGLSGGLTPCRHLTPSSGRGHVRLYMSVEAGSSVSMEE